MENSSFSHALTALFIFLFLTTFMGSSLATSIPTVSSKPNNNIVLKDYIKQSCNTTMYPSLCYNSLSIYSAKIQTNPKILAITALNITLSSTQSSLDSMKNLSRSDHLLNPRETSAMNDCLELLGDSGDSLKESVVKLDHIEPGPKFEYDMSDVQTWASAALTDDDTCMDGFDEDGVREEVRAMVHRRVLKALQLTSISLTFINNYAKY